MRAKIAPIRPNDDDIINDVAEAMNNYIFDDDDDQKNDKTSVNDITSSSINEQNDDLKEFISEKDSHQKVFNHYKKNPQPRLSNNNNERTSSPAINKTSKISNITLNERRVTKISTSQIESDSTLNVIIIDSTFTLILRDNIRRSIKFIVAFIRSSRIRKTNTRVKFDETFDSGRKNQAHIV